MQRDCLIFQANECGLHIAVKGKPRHLNRVDGTADRSPKWTDNHLEGILSVGFCIGNIGASSFTATHASGQSHQARKRQPVAPYHNWAGFLDGVNSHIGDTYAKTAA